MYKRQGPFIVEDDGICVDYDGDEVWLEREYKDFNDWVTVDGDTFSDDQIAVLFKELMFWLMEKVDFESNVTGNVTKEKHALFVFVSFMAWPTPIA